VILRDVIFKAILKTGELRMDEDILYERWTKIAVERVDRGEAKLAFLVNPLSAEAVGGSLRSMSGCLRRQLIFILNQLRGLVNDGHCPGERLG